MHRKRTVAPFIKTLVVRATLAVAVTGAMQAQAGCGQFEQTGRPVSFTDSLYPTPKLISTSFQMVDDESFEWRRAHQSPITGLWYFKYVSKGNAALGIPDGAQIDGGNTLWFADGNEMTSSALRAPNTGSICLGVWKQTGERSYELNHIGLSWDPIKNMAAGPAFIKQYVTLERGEDKYTGTFTIKQFAPDGETLEVELRGTIIANRVTVDTDKQLP